jgi:Putative cyclase
MPSVPTIPIHPDPRSHQGQLTGRRRAVRGRRRHPGLHRAVLELGWCGEDDQLDALEHVGPEQIRTAAALVRQGKVISLRLPLDLNGPQSSGFRANPPLSAGNVTAKGAATCGMEMAKSSFVMRGVLLDVARHQGVNCLEPGYPIIADDLDATAAAQGVEIRTGDAIIVRTGTTKTRRGAWATTTAARPRASPCTPRRGCTSTTSQPSPPTREASRFGPTRSGRSSPCTSWRWSTWASASARSGT